jgi:hypothetical protein
MSATFEEAIQPLLDAYAAIEADVAEKEAELAELKDKRNRLRNAVRALDPDRIPSANPKKKASGSGPGQASVDYVRRFLLGDASFTGEFGSTRLLEQPGYTGVGASSLPAVLRILHEEGTIRLVRKGKGSSRYYEVIR